MSKNLNNETPKSIKSYKIEKETYKLLNTVLYTATNTDINEKVLIHIFPKEQLKSSVHEVSFMNNQVFLMKLLNHKNILKLYEIIETKTHSFLVYEYFNGVKLSDYISKKKKLDEEEAITIFKEILSALIYIHGMYICDLNLSSNNIIIDTNNNIKICDFKYGHFYSTKEKSKPRFIGDHPFLSPELHSKKNYNPELADMWSSGVILYHMLTGNLPFNPKKGLDMIRSIIKVEYTIPSFIADNLIILIKGLMEKDEEKRLKLNDIFNQQYFKEKNITKKELIKGLNVLSMKYPIDPKVLNICTNNLGMDSEKLVKYLENNKFTPYTSIFNQIVTKLKNNGIKTINDLSSDIFLEYINDPNNFLKEDQQINNIQNYLKKEEDVTKNAKDVAAILLNNQNEISKGLEDLKRQFIAAKRGHNPRKRQKSFNYGVVKNKRLDKFDMDDKSNNTKKLNIKAVKRNTLIVTDVRAFNIKEEKNTAKKRDSKAGARLNININNNKNEEKKIIEPIKEEEEKDKDKVGEGKKNELNQISEKSVDSTNKDEKIETPQQRPTTASSQIGGVIRKKKESPNKKKVNNTNYNSNNNAINQLHAVKLNKVSINDKKPKKNETNEELEKKANYLKMIKGELKKPDKNYGNYATEPTPNLTRKSDVRPTGIKGLREIFEASIRKQNEKKKIPGKKYI